MNFKSHTKNEVLQALREGSRAWVLNTGSDGAVIILLGESRFEVMGDVGYYADQTGKEWPPYDDLPNGWTVEEITAEELED